MSTLLNAVLRFLRGFFGRFRRQVDPLSWQQKLILRKVGEKKAASNVGLSNVTVYVALAGVIAFFAVCGAQILALQGEARSTDPFSNSSVYAREVVTYSPRGRILDRHGRVLADSTVAYQLSAVPRLVFASEDNQKLLTNLAVYLEAEGQPNLFAPLEEAGREYPLPVVLEENIDSRTAVTLQQRITDDSGVSLDVVPARSYDSRWGLAHIVGYTSLVTQTDIDESEEDAIPLNLNDTIGRSGIERTYDGELRGVNGVNRFEVNARGEVKRSLGSVEFQAGNDVRLTIDIDLQKALHEALQTQMEKANSSRASGVVTDPNTGEILAMVSLPAYDNNLFAQGISQADFDSLASDNDQPLVNKVISAGYTSGSVIKPIVAAAALEEAVVDENTVIVDRGSITVNSQFDSDVSYTFRGWRESGLGAMNVRSALAWSSNIYFYTVGGGFESFEGLGQSRLTSYYREFGLGQPTGIDLPGEIAGRVPDATWKQETLGEEWFVGDSYNISIGQGDLLISPIQIHAANSAIVNNGNLITPSFRADAGSSQDVPVASKHLGVIREGMRQVLTNGTTCECVFSDVGVRVAGKSGTAETNTPDGRAPHAWYTAFAPFERPEIMATVMIEEGSGGSQFAAPVIADIMEVYFSPENGATEE